jgi:mannose-6-phosphate isomerase-like protein (cupin superfamily)
MRPSALASPNDGASYPEPGTTFYVPKNAPHQFLNMGKAPYDVVVVTLK